MIRQLLLSAALLCSINCNAQQTDFYSSHVKVAAEKLSLTQLDTLHAGSSIIAYKGKDIIVRKNNAGQVEHIGMPLFSDEMRTYHPSPIYDYLEYSLLDYTYKISDNPMSLLDLKFRKGSWKQLSQVNAEMPVNIQNVQEKVYLVGWQNNGADFVEVFFPIKYDVMANSTHKEMEEIFIRDLKTFKKTEEQHPSLAMEQMVENESGDNILVKEGSTFFIPEVNTNTYFVKEGDTLKALYDRKYPGESFANLILDGAGLPEATLNVEFVKYDYKTESLNIKLSDFIAYAKKNGCQPFVGIEEVSSQKVEASLFLSNRNSGYAHVISLTSTVASLFSEVPEIEAVAYLFTPTSNIKTLFDASKSKKSTKKQYVK